MSEMVGPAGSMSEGAFSRAYNCPEEELWLEEELLGGLSWSGRGGQTGEETQTTRRREKQRNASDES